MKLFILNDKVIREILNSITLEDKTLYLIEKIIHQFDNSLSSFVYSMFSAYTTYYVRLYDQDCHLSYKEAQSICSNLTKTNLNIDHGDILIADIYDILYANSAFDKTRFKCYFYEDFYSKTENILGASKAVEHMEDMFDALETMFSIIEETLVLNIINQEEHHTNVIFYLELKPNELTIYVL